jgi:DNA invertase Pin-like site-specific DNA recombinase
VPKVYFVHSTCSGRYRCVSTHLAHARTRARNNRPIVDSGNKFSHYTEDVTVLQSRIVIMATEARVCKVGYARVSTPGQKLDAQLDALIQAGCMKTFMDQVSGITADRPGWDQLMAYVRPGDTVVITELSRMTRSLVHLLEVVRDFEQREIELISLREHIDTSTATGRCFLAIMGAMAQMERELKAERTAAGRAAAKARGRTGGRPRTDPDKLEQARILYLHANKTAADVCRTVGIGRRTLFSYLAQVRHQKEGQQGFA